MGNIVITIKYYSGIEKELEIEDYDLEKGVLINVRPGITLKSILKDQGLKKHSQYIFFSCGHHISTWKRFYESAEISCLKVSGGG